MLSFIFLLNLWGKNPTPKPKTYWSITTPGRCQHWGPLRRIVAGASLPVRQGWLSAKPDGPQDPGAESLLSQQALPALKHEQNSNDRFCQDRVVLLCLNQGQLQDLVPPQKQLCLFLHRPGGRPAENTIRRRVLLPPFHWQSTFEFYA